MEYNCPFAYIELWEKVQLPMQSMHQQTCSMSHMPEHNRDCTPLCVELPLLRPHACCEVCHPQRGVPRSTGQRVYSKGAGEEAKWPQSANNKAFFACSEKKMQSSRSAYLYSITSVPFSVQSSLVQHSTTCCTPSDIQASPTCRCSLVSSVINVCLTKSFITTWSQIHSTDSETCS